MTDKNISVPVDKYIREYKSERALEWEENRGSEYKEYRRKWVENPKNFILEEGPLNLDIEITNLCNLKCPMCPRTILIRDDISVDNEKYKLGFMDWELYTSLIDQAEDIGVSAVKLNWLGEPTMHKDLIRMVDYAKRKGILEVLINTNAVLLDQNLAEGLIKAGLDKLLFSFDSPYKENYEKIRIGADFNTVLSNIKNVRLIREKLKMESPLTRVLMVLMKENQDHFKDLVELFKDDVDIVAWGEFTNEEELIGEDRKIVKRKKIENFACAQLWQRMFVSWNGKVVVCCADAKMNYVVGDARKEKIKDIWKNEKYSQIREMHMKGGYDKIYICSICDIPEFGDED